MGNRKSIWSDSNCGQNFFLLKDIFSLLYGRYSCKLASRQANRITTPPIRNSLIVDGKQQLIWSGLTLTVVLGISCPPNRCCVNQQFTIRPPT